MFHYTVNSFKEEMNNLGLLLTQEEEQMVEALVSKIIQAPKFRYSQMIKAGPNYVCSGMVGLDNDTGKLVDGNVADEMRQIFKNLQLLMKEFNLTWQELVSAKIFTTEFEQFPEINAVWEEIFTQDIRPPARSAFGVTGLPMAAKVEIDFTFYRECS